jgi:hypothetical protein
MPTGHTLPLVKCPSRGERDLARLKGSAYLRRGSPRS